MNVPALQKVVCHLNIANVHPVNISFDVSPNRTISLINPTGELTFSRFQWGCIGQGNIKAMLSSEPNGDAQPQHFVSLLFKTVAEIATQPISGPVPESEPIPPEMLIAKIEATFAADYLVDADPATLDVEGMQEFIKHNAPYHFWPYWRELVQNLSMRAQIPVPNLPSYRVPTEAQGA